MTASRGSRRGRPVPRGDPVDAPFDHDESDEFLVHLDPQTDHLALQRRCVTERIRRELGDDQLRVLKPILDRSGRRVARERSSERARR